jgi:hypothetical protein
MLAGMGTNKRYPREPPPDARRRHCWVLGTAHERGPWPGLILEWRRTNGGEWAARVVYVPNPREPRSVEAWFVAALLRPLDPSRPPPGRVDFR